MVLQNWRAFITVGPVFIARLNYCIQRFAEAFANLIVAIDLQIRSRRLHDVFLANPIIAGYTGTRKLAIIGLPQ